MSIYSVEDAKKYHKEALDARSATLKSQEYKIANRTQRRAMLSEVNADLEKWENELKAIYAANPELNPNKTTQRTRRGPTVSTVGYRHG